MPSSSSESSPGPRELLLLDRFRESPIREPGSADESWWCPPPPPALLPELLLGPPPPNQGVDLAVSNSLELWPFEELEAGKRKNKKGHE